MVRCGMQTLPSLSKPWERVFSDMGKIKNTRIPNGIHPPENASRPKCLMKRKQNWKGKPSESQTFMFHSAFCGVWLVITRGSHWFKSFTSCNILVHTTYNLVHSMQ